MSRDFHPLFFPQQTRPGPHMNTGYNAYSILAHVCVHGHGVMVVNDDIETQFFEIIKYNIFYFSLVFFIFQSKIIDRVSAYSQPQRRHHE